MLILITQIRDQFRSYFVKTIIAITTLYITFGVAGYLSYGRNMKENMKCGEVGSSLDFPGPETNQIITLNLPSEGGFNFAILVKVCLCFRYLI